MRDIYELIEAVDLVVGRARGVASDWLVAQAADRARSLRSRRGFHGESLVLAIAGGTGSGKSSLLNAIAGEPVSSVSHLRPHTDEPVAWLPEDGEPGLRLLVDELRIGHVVTQRQMPGLALIDLPDLDSIAEWHRRTVEELLPRVDGVIWLFDPEKYHDRSLHRDFLSRLAAYRDQFVFVLNKIDRLPAGADAEVKEHLERILADDGHADASVFAVAAAPDGGEPVGIEGFASFLYEQLDAKRMAVGKAIADAEQLLRTLGEATGLWGGGSLVFAERWRRVRARAAADLSSGRRASARENALCQIEDLIAALAVEVGDDFGDLLRRRITLERIEASVRIAAEEASDGRGESRWWPRYRSTSAQDDAEDVERALDEGIGEPLHSLLWERARLGATIAYAAVGARQLRARLMSG